ncbi:hypothetical protein Tco_0545632 [Tanacetum coccineum]
MSFICFLGGIVSEILWQVYRQIFIQTSLGGLKVSEEAQVQTSLGEYLRNGQGNTDKAETKITKAHKLLLDKDAELQADEESLCGLKQDEARTIENERRSGGTCQTTYWITLVRHEAADAESAPMPLAMPCLVPWHGGGFVARHEHRAKGRTDRPGFSRALAGSGVTVKGASAYPEVIITTCTSNLGTVEHVTRLLFHSTTFVPVIHSLTERSSEGQPAHTAIGEDGTTGKDHLAKTPQAQSMVGLRQGSMGRKGSPDGGRARGGWAI